MKKSFTAKLWKPMTLCAAQGVIAITLCGVAFAHTNYAQLLDREISVHVIDIPFEQALREIEAATNVKFVYSIDQLLEEPNVSLSAEKRSLREVLEEVLTPRKIRYRAHEKDGAITLTKPRRRQGRSDPTGSGGREIPRGQPLLIEVSGTVIEGATQTPMPGVNVIVKGTTRGTSTDATGHYSIGADENDILVFSFIGYTALEISVNGRTQIDVSLREDMLSLKEVVINAGYYTTTRLKQTGSIAGVGAEEISRQPVSNPLQAMQGRMSGVYVQQESGIPGSNFEVRIRGRNGIESGNDPLYIVDGVPYNSTSLSTPATSATIQGASGVSPLNSLNVNDIESIEVLKDADATAIYGSRGANGVILITTKKGSAGQTRLDVNINSGISQVARKVDLMNTAEYIAMRNEAFENDGIAPNFWDYDANGTWSQDRYTDWQEVLIGGTARSLNSQLSLSGGSASTQFLVSAAYMKQTTVFPGDLSYSKGSAHLSLTHASSNDRLKASVSANYIGDVNDLVNNDFTSLSLSLAPNAPALYNDVGQLNWENATWKNPLALLENKYYANSRNLLANAVVSYELLEGLQLKSSVGFNSMLFRDRNMFPSSTVNPALGLTPAIARLQMNTNEVGSWIVEPQASYYRSIGKGKLSAIVGSTFQQQISEQMIQVGVGFSSDALIENIAAASSQIVARHDRKQYRYSALFGRLNFEWASRYFVNLTGRRDGSSRFGPGRQFANFGAIGAAWVFTGEPFMKEALSILSFGKFRSSYGTAGNDQIGDYEFLDTYSTGGSYQQITGLAPDRLYNPDFMWEVNRKFEVALELGFMKDRLLLNVAYFKNRSSNQLLGYTLPATTGFGSIRRNLPATVENTGMEFEVRSVNIRKDRWEWSTDFNITIPRNRLVNFPDLETSTYRNAYAIGEPLNISKRYHMTGIDPVSGLFEFEDMNGDGNISSLDRLVIKETGQTLYGGLNNSLRYKDFSVTFFFQFVKQTAPTYFSRGIAIGGGANQPDVVRERWTPDGDAYRFQRYTAGNDNAARTAYSRYALSDATIGDASFIRLKNISISYLLPRKLTGSIKVNAYLQGQNVWTITDYMGLDPENYGRNVLPPLRTFIAGVQLSI